MRGARLQRLQRAVGWLLAGVAVLLVANSTFLATSDAARGLVGPMLQVHVGLGWTLTVLLVPFVAVHVRLHRRHRNVAARRIGVLVATIASVGCVAGAAGWWMHRGRGARGLLLLHEGAFALAIATYLLHRVRARVTPALRGERIAAVGTVSLVAAIWVAQVSLPAREGLLRPGAMPLNAGLTNAQTRDGHVLSPADLADPAYCAQCHGGIAARWQSSAHRHSSLGDPFYAASLKVGQAHRTPDQMKFCGGCHDPLLVLTGRMDVHPTPQSPDADAGITCLACHAIEAIPSRVGNGSYRIAPVEHYPGFGSDDPQQRELGARMIRSKPAQHKASLAPEHLRSPQMCLPCHKAHIPAALNGEHWLAGQNEYDPWFDSGAGGHSARTFFPPAPVQKRCQDCHMPRIASDDPAAREGTVADHAFPGSNTALPTVLGDRAWAQRSAAFLGGILVVDIGAVQTVADDGDVRVLAPSGPVAIPPGAATTVEVVVRNVGSGHLFPGGIADVREVWLEATLTRSDGTIARTSGWVDARGHLDPDAHRWNAVLLDADGDVVRVHDVERAAVVLAARRIMLGASDVVRLAFEAPRQASTLQVRVLHRTFDRHYVEFALGSDAPAMPVTELARASLSLRPGDAATVEPGPDTGPRLRNLGIGHLLRGDTALARQAASAAAIRMPEDPGPPLDLARAALADGALEDALGFVRAADGLQPGHPTAAWLLAEVRAAQGDHRAALQALHVARAAFPEDRALLVMEARALFKLERDAEAAARLERVLEIDPENVSAHAMLMRIRSAAGDAVAAAAHEEAWARVRPASSDQTAIERARREHPELDRRANEQRSLPMMEPRARWRRADGP